MPELAEVETTVLDLRKKVLLRTFKDIWTDFEKTAKKLRSFKEFKKRLKRERIKLAGRSAHFCPYCQKL